MRVCVQQHIRTALAACLLALGTAMGATPSAAHEFTINGLHIYHPYAIEPVERLPTVLPVYMKIRNTGATPDRLIGVASSHAKSAVLVGGADAGLVTGIDIPVNGHTTLGPATAHIQLRDLTEPVEGYEYFAITLTFEKAGRVDIEVCVEDRPEAPLIH